MGSLRGYNCGHTGSRITRTFQANPA